MGPCVRRDDISHDPLARDPFSQLLYVSNSLSFVRHSFTISPLVSPEVCVIFHPPGK
jgi:hypothetical protein